ncbi:MAG: aminopeptidase N [Candidatus Ancillula sp.]|jgi:aminopeptidase N|nr:aminopeptidase N [Candidatus Ancillula sp.]
MPADNLTRIEAQNRKKLVSDVRYQIFLDITSAKADSPLNETFVSKTKIQFTYNSDAVDFNTEALFVDLKARKINDIVLNGQNISTDNFKDYRLTLPGNFLQSHNELIVNADCEFTNTGEGLHKFVAEDEGEVYLYTQFEVADSRRVFACFEQPDIKATFDWTVKAPAGWVLTSTEREIEKISENSANGESEVWKFATSPIMSTYLTSLCAGPFQVWEDSLINSDGREIPMRIVARKSMAEFMDAEDIFQVTKDGFAFYNKEFQVPFPWNKYDQVFMPQYNAGAMENIGNVTFREDYIFRSKPTKWYSDRRVITILHELAHMWFGDLVTMKWWNDLWLNESFAEYTSTIAGAEGTKYGDNSWVTFNIGEKSWGVDQDQLPSTHPVAAEIKDLNDVLVNFDGITYAKGAAILQALTSFCGRENFFNGIKNYLNKHSHSNAELSDLLGDLQAAVTASGSDKDVLKWAELWLQTAGINTLIPHFELDNEGKFSSFEVEQIAPENLPTLRPHTTKIGLYSFTSPESDINDNMPSNVTATGSLNLRGIKLTLVKEVPVDILPKVSTEVPELIGTIKPDLIVINNTGETFAKVRLDDSSLKVALSFLPKIKDPLARAQVYRDIWDYCRDGLMNVGDFIDITIKVAASETESITLRRIFDFLKRAVFEFVPSNRRSQIVRSVGTSIWELGRESEPGSDAQLQFILAFCDFASTEDHVSILKSLLSGDIVLPKFEIDIKTKWEIIKALARLGATDRARIQTIAEQGKSEIDNLGSRYAVSALPNIELKKAAFEKAYDKNSGLANSEIEAIALGFVQVLDTKILADFAPVYFENINKVWDEREFAIAETILEVFYPSRLANLELAQMAEKWLDENEKRPKALRRIISEQLDSTRRALKVQKFSNNSEFV